MQRVLLVFVSLLLLSGCHQKEDYKIRVALNSWPGYEPLVLAREMGFFDNNPFDIVRLHSNTDAVKALRSGILDIAALTMDEVLRLAQDTPDMTVFLVLDISDGGDAIVAHKGITSMQELKGKRVGVEGGALGAYVLTRALEQTRSLELADLEIYPVRYKNHETAFEAGDVDAVVTFEPVKSRLVEQGGKVLFDSTQIPGEIVDVLVVRNAVASRYPQAMQTLVRGWFRALEYIHNNPKTAFAKMASYEKIGASLFEAGFRSMRFPTLAENRRLLAAGEPEIIEAVAKVKANLLKNKILVKDIPLEPLFSDRYLIREAR